MRQVIQTALLERAAKLQYDLVVFSGDIANSADSTEYGAASKFLTDLASSRPIVVVPGNHDVVRGLADGPALRDAHTTKAAYLAAKSSIWDPQRFGAFQEFSTGYLLPWGSAAVASAYLDNVSFIGINTGLLSYRNDERGKLAVDQEALNVALVEAQDRGGLTIAVGHHPLKWLVKWNRQFIRQALSRQRRGAHLYLHGHLHVASGAAVSTTQGSRLTVIQAGATYQNSKWEQSFWHLELLPELSLIRPSLYRFLPKAGEFASDPERSQQITCDLGGATGPAAGTTAAVRSASPSLPDTPRKLAEDLEERFHIIWEPTGLPGDPQHLFWSVRLRRPTLIHAAQAFVAAALQKSGVRVHLCLDDLGNAKGDPNIFLSRMRKHFELVSASWGEVTQSSSKAMLTEARLQTTWTVLAQWLSSTERLDQALAVCKFLRLDASDAMQVDPSSVKPMLEKKPRKIMTPAVVWSCFDLQLKPGEPPGPGWITLGGHDERLLWRTWREVFSTQYHVGHVYLPELANLTSQGSGNLNMGDDDRLFWESRDDILASLRLDASPPSDADHLLGWMIRHCLLLPETLRGRALDIAGHRMAHPNDVAALDSASREQVIGEVAKKARALLFG